MPEFEASTPCICGGGGGGEVSRVGSAVSGYGSSEPKKKKKKKPSKRKSAPPTHGRSHHFGPAVTPRSDSARHATAASTTCAAHARPATT